MFSRLFGSGAPEQEEKLADRGPAPPEGSGKDSDDAGANASDGSSGVIADPAPEGMPDRSDVGRSGSVATDDAGAPGDLTTVAEPNDELATESTRGDDLAADCRSSREAGTVMEEVVASSEASTPEHDDHAAASALAGNHQAKELAAPLHGSGGDEDPHTVTQPVGPSGTDVAGHDRAGREAIEPESLPRESDPAQLLAPELIPSELLGRESDPRNPLPPQIGPPMAGPRRGRKGRRLARPEDEPARRTHTPEERLLLLDTWQRSGLPAKDFAALVGVSKYTLYKWKQQFERLGPAGLMDQPRGGPRGSRLPEVTKRTILMMKAAHPEWGCQRISDMLLRGPALPASASAVARVLHEAGYERVEEPTRPHPDKVRRFERAKSNDLWQSDLFTFVLKRQNRRVYLVAFMDDHSRFITAYGLHASQSSALVLEVLRAGIASYGTPEEILTDNGSQYVTWRGKSAFTKELEKRGIKQIVARPRRPQTLDCAACYTSFPSLEGTLQNRRGSDSFRP